MINLERAVVFDSPRIRIPTNLRPLERKRRSVWNNGPRNRTVAEIARSFCDADPRQRDWTDDVPRARTVAVLVESREHLERLADMLPAGDLNMVSSVDMNEGSDVDPFPDDRPEEIVRLCVVTLAVRGTVPCRGRSGHPGHGRSRSHAEALEGAVARGLSRPVRQTGDCGYRIAFELLLGPRHPRTSALKRKIPPDHGVQRKLTCVSEVGKDDVRPSERPRLLPSWLSGGR